MELPGAGQVYVTGDTAYVGHITNRAALGTSVLDVSDPREPRLLAQLKVDEPDSHSHKVRVVGNLMAVNVEQNLGALGRKGVDGSAQPTDYPHGGFKLYDVSDRANPKFITHVKTWGRGEIGRAHV